ncbi:acyl-CoA/acyl-ACP dehydrogenase [Nocardioides sp. KIGAM211]|uniref:Medium-chain specific acyl-CoA dehydrogenase, mitochondrial n=1 Tax=Nocardioides luti TaxID=2761101 RepID=A0A7X0VBU8_9ACTN|nr:acyl-CoA dehydrogenase family protein [Nocardioides luti]MBB6627568.1 acyl-CoA/acyl-ACP dehydrogenase [Nocardioides luti]
MSDHTTEEVAAIREVAREFTRRHLIPLEREVIRREVERGFKDEPLITLAEEQHLIDESRKLGLVGIDVPEEYGGLGLGMSAKAAASEELAYSITPFKLFPDSPNLHYLEALASPSQREEFLVPYAKGEKRSCLALTEPDAGSDIGGIKTRATKIDGGWSITGNKLWISFLDRADFIIVIAITDSEKGKRGGMSAFLVDKDTPGLIISDPIPTMGEQRPYELRFDDVRVTDDRLLGEPGQAFAPLTNRLGVRRVDIGARCVGMSRRLIDMMCDYTLHRETFGTKLADRQGVQFMIADARIDLEAAQMMVNDAARRLDGGLIDIRIQASALKVFSTEMLTRTVDKAMQLHGAMGYSKELPIEFIYRSSRILRISEGASEIHRWQIARMMLKDPANRY